MRLLILFAVVAGCFISCNQGSAQKKDYKAVRDEVMEFHDVVMADHGRVVKNQMILDTMIKSMKELELKFPDVDTIKEKDTISGLITSLSAAEESMNDWMHTFEPDVTGKSNEEAISYFQTEKRKITALDSVYKAQIKTSDNYLKKFNKR